MIAVGTKIDTSFELKVIKEGEEHTLPFVDLLDRPTIVSVYMKNNTPGCDRQNESLAEHAQLISDKGYNIVAISKDGCGSHKKYADKKGINYVLASDPDHLFSKAADAMVEKKMYGKVYEGPARAAYLIDTDGTVKAIIEKVNTKAHAEEVLALIDAQ
jgi:peroxiredoxin Q/BCP